MHEDTKTGLLASLQIKVEQAGVIMFEMYSFPQLRRVQYYASESVANEPQLCQLLSLLATIYTSKREFEDGRKQIVGQGCYSFLKLKGYKGMS